MNPNTVDVTLHINEETLHDSITAGRNTVKKVSR